MSINDYEYRFMPRFSRHESETIDSTAAKEWMQCPRKYFYRIVLGRVPRNQRYQIIFDFGSAYHKFREILELQFQKTGSVDTASLEAMRYILGVKLPQPGFFAKKFEYLDNQRLIETCKVGFQYWQNEKKLGKIKVLVVEQPFNVRMGDDGEYTSGRMDQLIEWNGRIWNRDFKTSSKDQKTFTYSTDPNDQAIRYIYAGGQLHGQPIAGTIFEVIYQTKTVKPHIYTVPVSRTPAQINEWLEEQKLFAEHRKQSRQLDVWPKATGYQCTFCDYAQVCRKTTESSQAAELENNFILSPWDHTKVEQETL